MKIWTTVTLIAIFAVLFTTRILIPLKTGQKPQIIEQNRPTLPPPNYSSSLEQQKDEERFDEVVSVISDENDLRNDDVKELLFSALDRMEREIPFNFSQDLYTLRCLPEPTSDFEVHKRMHLGDSSLGVPIYLDVRVYQMRKDQVLQKLFAAIEGTFERVPSEEGACYIGRGQRLFEESTHGFAAALGERGVFFHLVEQDDRIFVTYSEAPWDDLVSLLPTIER